MERKDTIIGAPTAYARPQFGDARPLCPNCKRVLGAEELPEHLKVCIGMRPGGRGED